MELRFDGGKRYYFISFVDQGEVFGHAVKNFSNAVIDIHPLTWQDECSRLKDAKWKDSEFWQHRFCTLLSWQEITNGEAAMLRGTLRGGEAATEERAAPAREHTGSTP